MNNLIPIGRTFFALGLLGLAVEQFIFGDFVTGRAPAWPESMPGRLAWAYERDYPDPGIHRNPHRQTRACRRDSGLPLDRLVGPGPAQSVLAAESFLSGAWTRAGKALTFAAGMLVMAAASPGRDTSRAFHP